jgi:DNA-binding NarL/FixJ family response regulator
LADVPGAIVSFERAYAMFRARPDHWWSAATALRLSLHYAEHLDNRAAAAGWLARASRLVDDHALADLEGEVLLMRAGLAGDPADGERAARDALTLSRRAATRDLELCALSQLGALLVEQGRVSEGINLLDEAMAGCLGGEPASPDTVAFSSCLTMRSCARCADFERALQWVRASARFTDQYGSPFLQAECRVVHGMVLVATGDWHRAEDELDAAIRQSEGAVPAFHADAMATLADLRLNQGRLDEAERLLLAHRGHRAAAPVLARLHLERGRLELAAATARRAREASGRAGLTTAALDEILGEVEVAEGRHEAAERRGRSLAEAGRGVECQVIIARGERLRGHALAATRPDEARRHLDAAIDAFHRLAMPMEVARTRMLLAQTLRPAEPALAVAEAGTALEAFERLGASGHADAAAALLRVLGVRAARSSPRGDGPLTRRERDVFALLGEGLSNPQIAERLFVSRKTVEHHVASILAKLGLRNRAHAAAEAVRAAGGRAAE